MVEAMSSMQDYHQIYIDLRTGSAVLRTIIIINMYMYMGIEEFHSVMGRNIRLMQSRFKMEDRNVSKFSNHKCDTM